jgi:hypothetical protein
MIQFWNNIKEFFTNHIQHAWLENHLLYLFLLGLAISIVLLIIIMIKTRKDIRKMDKEKRKRDKAILKFLSDRKNKTF